MIGLGDDHGGERGSGTVLAIAILGATVSLATGALALAGGFAVRERVATAADASALAAADVSSGMIPGYPCAVAETVAAADGGRLDDCAVDGLVATTTVAGSFAGLSLEASARAGPP